MPPRPLASEAPPPAPPHWLGLTGPLLLELLLGLAAGLAGTALAARQGDTAAAAFALAHQALALLFVLLRVVGAGISVVVSQRLGAQRPREADDLARAALAASTWMGLGLALAALLGASAWTRLMQAPDEVAALAQPLLMALAPALLLDAWVSAQCSVLRSHWLARPVLLTQGAMLVLQVALAAWWMDSEGGLLGFAAAMAVSRFMGWAVCTRLWRRRLGLRVSVAQHVRLQWPHLAAVLRVGVPGAAENILYRVCALVGVAVAGTLGTQALATQAYAFQFNAITMLPAVAIGLSLEIVVGHRVGAGRFKQARRLTLRALAGGLALSVGLALAVALSGRWWLQAFTRDPAVVEATLVLLWWTVALEPGRTFNIVVINALRAAGDIRFPLLAGMCSMVVVLAGGSWWLGVHLGWGLPGVWVAYAADEWIRGLVMWQRWQRLGWLPHARRLSLRRPEPLSRPH